MIDNVFPFGETHPPGGPTQRGRINARKHLGPALKLVENTAAERGATDPAQVLGIAMCEILLLHADKAGVMTEKDYKRSLASVWMMMEVLLNQSMSGDPDAETDQAD